MKTCVVGVVYQNQMQSMLFYTTLLEPTYSDFYYVESVKTKTQNSFNLHNPTHDVFY